jgi:hypothetical protein
MAKITPEQWSLLEKILPQALELDEIRRKPFLDEACGSDHQLRRDVESLIDSDSDHSRMQIETHLLADEAVVDPLEGTQVGSYRLGGKLGRGGMGEVYLAERQGDYRREEQGILFLSLQASALGGSQCHVSTAAQCYEQCLLLHFPTRPHPPRNGCTLRLRLWQRHFWMMPLHGAKAQRLGYNKWKVDSR